MFVQNFILQSQKYLFLFDRNWHFTAS